MNEMKSILKYMKGTAAAGIDGIAVKTLKNMLRPLYQALLNMINTCITTAEYPDALKGSRVVPLRKGTKPVNEALNYRAVNILPSLRK